MDPKLVEQVRNHTPKMNPRIAKGLAYSELAKAMEYVSDVCSCIINDQTSIPDIKFVGIERCSPTDEYQHRVWVRKERNGLDMARTDTFFSKLKFVYKGEDIVVPMSLPAVSEANIMHIRNIKYHICPIVTDKIISPSSDSIFVSLIRTKLIFKRFNHSYYVDGNKIDSASVIHSIIHNQSKNNKNVFTTTLHYLLTRQGFTELFKELTGCKVEVKYASDITNKTHPSDKWVFFSSTKKKPNSLTTPNYVGTDMVVCVKKPIPNSSLNAVRTMISSFFYIVDHFPQRLTPESIEDPDEWKILLGSFIWGFNVHIGTIHATIHEHLESLDQYVDTLMQKHFKRIGCNFKDMFELLKYIQLNFNKLTIVQAKDFSNMYKKTVNVNNYTLAGIQFCISKLFFTLLKKHKKGDLNFETVKKTIESDLSTNVITKITAENGEVRGVDCSTDSYLVKLTTVCIQQEGSSKSKPNATKSVTDPKQMCHVSIPETGGYMSMTTSNPSGRDRLNPYVELNEAGDFMPNPELKDIVKKTHRQLTSGMLK